MIIVPEGYEASAAVLKLHKALDRMKRQVNDVVAPDEEERERLNYLVNQVMDSAHEILDLAHEFKQAALASAKENAK
jgi:hypothetical protein